MINAQIVVCAFLNFTVIAGWEAQASITQLSRTVAAIPASADGEVTLDSGLTSATFYKVRVVTANDLGLFDLSDTDNEAGRLARPLDFLAGDSEPVPELPTFALIAFALSVGAALLKARRKAGNC